MMTCFVAGGIAGNVHAAVRHLTAAATTTTTTNTTLDNNATLSLWNKRDLWRRMIRFRRRRTAVFVPTGLMFVAFDYGAIVADRIAQANKNKLL